MAEYDYRCLRCGRSFTITESMTEHGTETHHCPFCKSTRVQRVLTPLTVKTSKKS